MKTSIAILEPHDQIRDVITALLTDMGYHICLQTGKIFDFFNIIGSIDDLPDVCIIDVNPYDMKGFDISRQIKEKYLGVKTILYSNDLNEQVLHKFENNKVADFYVDKKTGSEMLQRAIEFCTRALLVVPDKNKNIT